MPRLQYDSIFVYQDKFYVIRLGSDYLIILFQHLKHFLNKSNSCTYAIRSEPQSMNPAIKIGAWGRQT
jgi:hypothetical protein